jgi:hypothetical protein
MEISQIVNLPGAARLNYHEYLFKNIDFIFKELADIKGDIVEAGVWEGLMITYMAYKFPERTIWACDSFEGCPYDVSQIKYKDTWENGATQEHKRRHVAEEEFLLENLKTHKIANPERVKILKGWFTDTLPNSPIKEIALLRVDCDIYSSTYEVLENLYPKLAYGGFMIFDDWGMVDATKAIMEYLSQTGDVFDLYDPHTEQLIEGFKESMDFSIVPAAQGVIFKKLKKL